MMLTEVIIYDTLTNEQHTGGGGLKNMCSIEGKPLENSVIFLNV